MLYSLSYHLRDSHWETFKAHRLKTYIDLRTAFECILKCGAALYLHPELKGEALYNKLCKYSHNKLFQLKDSLEETDKINFPKFFKENQALIERLPYELKYFLDGQMFLAAHEDLYYQTIGQGDQWLDDFEESIKNIRDQICLNMRESNGIISSSELRGAVMGKSKKYNKYLTPKFCGYLDETQEHSYQKHSAQGKAL